MPDRLVVKNGSKTLSTCSGGIGRAVVLDQDLDFQMSRRPLVAHGDGQNAARRHRLDRIFENAEEDLLHLGFVRSNGGKEAGVFLDHLNAGRFQFRGHYRKGVFDHFRDAAEPASSDPGVWRSREFH